MIKILLRKNMLEIKEMYFRDKKKGGSLSGGAKAGMVFLYIFLFILLAASFGAMASLFFLSSDASTNWIGWAIMGLLAVATGTIINALTTYSQLYLARDNEFLLSMPIHPGDILKSRMVSVYIVGLIYIAMVWLPTIVAAVATHSMSGMLILPAIVMMLIVGILVLALTCLLGWVIALLAVKFKNQKILWVIISLIFIGGLYYFQFKSNKIFSEIAENMSQTGDIIQAKLWLFSLLGRATDGNLLCFVIFTLISAVLLVLAYLVLSKTFIKVTTTKAVGRDVKFSESQIKSMPIKKALRKKEWGRFFSSVTVMLNQGIAVIMMVIGAVFLFIKGDILADKILPVAEILPELGTALPFLVIVALTFLQSMSVSTASSISLEGKNLWMVQTLPVKPYDILRAKMDLGIELQGYPAILLAWAVSTSLHFSVPTLTGIVFFAAAYASLSSVLGLVLNLTHCRFDWTSETTVVKQGFAVTVTIFGGWLIGMLIAAAGYLLRNVIDVEIFLIGVDVLMYIGYALLNNWVKKEGCRIFQYL